MSSHCELAVSFLWVCNSHSELTATTAWWAHQLTSQIAQCKLIVWVATSQRAHSKLTVWAHLVSSLWGRWVASKWAYHELSCELSLQCVSCELKFFTGMGVAFRFIVFLIHIKYILTCIYRSIFKYQTYHLWSRISTARQVVWLKYFFQNQVFQVQWSRLVWITNNVVQPIVEKKKLRATKELLISSMFA